MRRGFFARRFFQIASLILSVLAFPSIVIAQNPTPDFWQCNNRIGGAWNFGTAPFACDVDPFGDPEILNSIFELSVLDDQASRAAERPRYMQELQPILRDIAEYYLRRRKPDVSSAEMRAWIRAWYAIAHQESFWSHYRQRDGVLKMMRGDFGHGHGLLQVDDRWHFVAVRDGIAAHLIDHAMYAMDEYYAAWQRAPAQSCVSSSTDYVARTRSAWSAYNGGPSRICRWTNPNSPHAPKDRQFFEKYQSQTWNNFIEDFDKVASVDVVCLAEGNTNCGGGGGTDPDPEQPNQGVLYAHAGGACVFDGAEFQCVENLRDSACLAASYSLADFEINEIDERFFESVAVNELDRHQLCTGSGLDLYRVGSAAVFGKNINLRSTPGGERLATVPRGSVMQILDFEVRPAADYPRYYMVEYNGDRGYVYAGNMGSSLSWLSPSNRRNVSPQYIVMPGNIGRIQARSGINLRATPGGRRLTAVGFQRDFEVQSIVVTGEENEVYYEIQAGSSRGYIYGGRIIPDTTTDDWLKLVQVN